MQTKTLLKRLKEIHDMLARGEFVRARKKMGELLEQVNYQLQKENEKEVDGKLLQHLMGWYLKLWENKPPEFYRYPKRHTDIIGRELKYLINLYQSLGKNIDELKAEYESFKKGTTKDKSLSFFRIYYLPAIDNRFKESRWTSKKFERGIDFYVKQKEDLPL
jgi:hypothetical protein